MEMLEALSRIGRSKPQEVISHRHIDGLTTTVKATTNPKKSITGLIS
jgi:hypothetical protein